ncbi:MAG: cytochrome c [Chromatiales bacterium]|nr:cytochrome c [Chromatiales bacterium]
MNHYTKLFLALMAGLMISACSEQQETTDAAVATPHREMNFAQVSQGGQLFIKHCAECHGAGGEGDPNWRVRDAEGMFPAPPLNGTGHAWHHPQKILFHVIKNGSPGGQGKMPAWKEKLSDEEILAIIAWFKSKWPDEVYEAWNQMNQRAEAGS